MTELLSKYKKNFKDFFEVESNNYYAKTFHAREIKSDKYVFLKIYDKNLIDEGPRDLLLKQIKREEDLTKKCKSKNIIELYYVLETDLSYIFVYEYYYKTLSEYLKEKIEGLISEKDFFIKIVRSIAEALKILDKQNIIHRDIKPNNIYIQKLDIEDYKHIENNSIIKLADFESSIEKKENDSIQIGSFLYLAPEIIENNEYDEKCDMWSLGITLYQLYFGITPYGIEYDLDLIQDKIYSDNFICKFSKIPTLDILFKKLLTINPQERMTHKEFYEYVNSKEFMQPEVIYKKEKYENIFKGIKNIENIEKYEKEYYRADIGVKEKIIAKLAISLDTALKLKVEKEKKNKEKKYINILYYNEDISHPQNLNKEKTMFEEETSGIFFFINNINFFETIMKEIFKYYESDKRYSFNLIVTGKTCEKIMDNLIKNKQEKCFQHICIFCRDIEQYKDLKIKYNKIEGIYNTKRNIIKSFIKKYSNQNIKPFPVVKFITYEEYQNEYFYSHLLISLYYGHTSQQSYLKNYEKLKILIHEKKNEIRVNKNALIDSFQVFDLKKDAENINKNIIKKYSENTFFGPMNFWLRNLDNYTLEEIAYFTSRFMYSLNIYATENNKYFEKNDIILYRGTKMNLSSLLVYEKSKGKIISLTSFTSMSELKIKAQKFAKRKNQDLFSVMYYVKNLYHENWISNGINIQDVAKYPKEREILFQPFSFYLITDVSIQISEKKAKIYLETIGKKEILEIAIQNGKQIKYNKDLNIIESI